MLKKGDLSINLIIIAIIALLVLVVVFAIFTRYMGQTNDDLDDQQIRAKMEAERLQTGDLAKDASCGAGATCQLVCSPENFIALQDEEPDARCGIGMICCSED